MDSILDILKGDAFNIISLTGYINQVKFVPGYLGQRGLFGAGTPSSTTVVGIEMNQDIFILVPVTPRGGPGVTIDKMKRNLRFFGLNKHEINDNIMAEEVQGVRALGTPNTVETVTGKLAERFRIHNRSFAATEELMRLGAVRGLLVYPNAADGTLSAPTLNLFAEFGVSQPAEINFALGTATDGALRKSCAAVIRQMADALEGIPFSGVEAICGDAFYDALISNPEVRASYLNQEQAAELRQGYVTAGGLVYGTFAFGGITWTNYRGSVGGVPFVNTDKCHLYPIGVDGLFDDIMGPADYLETVNTPGVRLYAKQYEMLNGKGVHLDTQTNRLFICRRPKTLIQGRRA